MNYGNIVMNKTICSGKFETKIGADIIVPDSQPDVSKVIYAQVCPSVGESYVSKDKITISGILCWSILYRSDEDLARVCTINYKMPFSHQIDVKGADDASNICVMPKVCSVEYCEQNSRKVNVSANLMFDICLTKYCEEEVKISCEEDIPVKSKEISSYNSVLTQKDEFLIEYVANVSGVTRLVNCFAKVVSKEIKIISNKVIVKGTTKINALFETADDTFEPSEFSVDFTEVLDVKEVDPDMLCSVDLDIREIEYNFASDDEKASVEFSIFAVAVTSAYDIYTYDVLCDAYSPDYEIDIKKEKLEYFELLKDSSERISITDYIDISRHSGTRICNVYSYPKVTSSSVINGKISVEGVLATTVLYLSGSESGVFSATKNISFSYAGELKSDAALAEVKTNLFVDNLSYSVNVSGEAEIKIGIEMKMEIIKSVTDEIIISIDVDKNKKIDKSDISSITIYFVQANDTLWNIAKKYHTTISEIASVNEIDENKVLSIGERLLIPKR